MSSPATPVSLPTQMHRPKRWREQINGVKQPCWCGEHWHDGHEDGNHGPVAVDPYLYHGKRVGPGSLATKP